MPGPKNAVTGKGGVRMYEWQEPGMEPVKVLSVTSIRKLVGIQMPLVEWQLGNIVRLAMGIRKITVIGPRGGVKEVYVKDGPFPGEFVARMIDSAGDAKALDAIRRWLRDTADEPRDIAAARGSVVHKLIELNVSADRVSEDLIRSRFDVEWQDRKRKIKPDVTVDDVAFVENAMRQYFDMRAHLPFVVLAQEPQVWNLTAGYAGSADVLMWFLPEDQAEYQREWQREASAGRVTAADVGRVGGRVALGDWKTSKGVYCVEASTPVLTDDLRWVPAGSLRIGDGLWSFTEDRVGVGRGGRRWMRSSVTRNEVREAECITVSLESGRKIVCTPDHPLLARRTSGGRGMVEGGTIWVKANDLRVGDTLPYYLSPWGEDESREAGWFAGLLDGEGCLSGHRLSFAQREGVVAERARAFMRSRGISWREYTDARGAIQFAIRGDVARIASILGSVRPSRLLAKFSPGDFQAPRSRRDRVVGIELTATGRHQIANLSTSSRTYIAAGYGSHNTDHVVQMHAYLAGEFIGSDGRRDARLTGLLEAMMEAVLIHIRPDGWAVDFADFQMPTLRAFLGSVAFARFLAENQTPDALFSRSMKGSAAGTEMSEYIEEEVS